MEIPDEDEIFDEIERHFNNFLTDPNQNHCCNEDERALLLTMVKTLKKIYPNTSDKDICLTILYTYYSLNLNEQTSDHLSLNLFKNYADNFQNFKKLYFAITTGSIMTRRGIDYASYIRYTLLGLQETLDKKRKNEELANVKSKKISGPEPESVYGPQAFPNYYKPEDFKFGGKRKQRYTKRRKTSKKRRSSRKRRYTKR